MPRLIVTAAAVCFLLLPATFAQSGAKPAQSKMSAMGQLAHQRIAAARPVRGIAEVVIPGEGDCPDGNERCFPNLPTVGSGGTQSETSIAVDSTGQHIVIGFNDTRGFSKSPLSVSGFMYSDNGGVTFTDGGQLPSPGNQTAFGQTFPQLYGDPDVKYLGGCNFIYSSIMIRVAGASLVQTLAIHRSTDCGHTWTGPIEVPPATNPNALVDVGGNPLDVADKELMDVDPDTGRVMIGWSNFTPVAEGGVEISVTYSDNILSANPTFAPRRLIASGVTDGQGASVKMAGNGSPNAYIAWTRSPGYYTSRIAWARSTDNGVTWSAPVEITPSFVRMDEVLGDDRVNEFPSVGVDNSPGAYKGNVYVVYSNNNSFDGADVSFRRSVDGGVTFSAPITLNSRPGTDRPQWFPYVAVDRSTGRVNVFYYDQGVDTSGHLTEVTYLYSDDGGTTWSRPAPLTDRPFKAGWGNDTSQPNLGDYNQAVAQHGILYASYAATSPQKFTDGQPSTQFITPDVYFSKVNPGTVKLPLRAGAVGFVDSGGNGNLDPGDTAAVSLALTNTDTNPLHAAGVNGVTTVLSTRTPGITITEARAAYPNIAPGGTSNNATPFRIALAPSFVPGTPIVFVLAVTSATGTTRLEYTQSTGTLLGTTLVSENFENVSGTALPDGWTAAHGAGSNTVPWITSKSFCGSSGKAFHQNAEDGPTNGAPTRWERLFSPTIVIPGDAQYVEVEFDVCYDTENDPVLRYTAYDGFFLRVTDLTPGRTLRSVLAEAFEEEFTTGPIRHYPRHLPRNDDSRYFEDMSAWAGDSEGYRRVRLKLPGMAGSTVQFRFEYTQDSNSTCADVRPGHVCGVAVDNFVVRSVRSVAPPAVNLIISPQLSRNASNDIVAQVTVRNTGTAAAQNVRLAGATLGTTSLTTLPVISSIPAGGSAVVTLVFPATAGSAGQASVLRVNGTYNGGTWSGNVRVTLP